MPKSATADQNTSRQQVRTYMSKLTPSARARLKELGDTIRKTAPGATDAFSYSIPAFRLNGRILVWYAAWKNHLSMYPLNAEDRKFATQKGFKTAKGTVQFPLSDPLPVSLVKRLVKSRMAAVKAVKT